MFVFVLVLYLVFTFYTNNFLSCSLFSVCLFVKYIFSLAFSFLVLFLFKLAIVLYIIIIIFKKKLNGYIKI